MKTLIMTVILLLISCGTEEEKRDIKKEVEDEIARKKEGDVFITELHVKQYDGLFPQIHVLPKLNVEDYHKVFIFIVPKKITPESCDTQDFEQIKGFDFKENYPTETWFNHVKVGATYTVTACAIKNETLEKSPVVYKHILIKGE
jgi:hypothetical protein